MEKEFEQNERTAKEKEFFDLKESVIEAPCFPKKYEDQEAKELIKEIVIEIKNIINKEYRHASIQEVFDKNNGSLTIHLNNGPRLFGYEVCYYSHDDDNGNIKINFYNWYHYDIVEKYHKGYSYSPLGYFSFEMGKPEKNEKMYKNLRYSLVVNLGEDYFFSNIYEGILADSEQKEKEELIVSEGEFF